MQAYDNPVFVENKPIPIPLKVGDALIFHGLIIHGTEPNVSKDRRRALQLHYMDARCRYTGKNEINPIAAIGAAGMMLDHLGYADAAAKVDQSISDLLASGKIKDLGAGRMGYTTEEVGDLIAEGL